MEYLTNDSSLEDRRAFFMCAERIAVDGEDRVYSFVSVDDIENPRSVLLVSDGDGQRSVRSVTIVSHSFSKK